uniref:C2H2-type domain-containing protein n=1 Tax=Cacopsylla melanoneura TaxID=428564 RepID=A0A8D8YC60_9HEMI
MSSIPAETPVSSPTAESPDPRGPLDPVVDLTSLTYEDIKKRCRLKGCCLGPCSLDIFTEENKPLQVPEKLRKYFNIIISQNDQLSHFICGKCYDELSLVTMFIEVKQENQRTMWDIYRRSESGVGNFHDVVVKEEKTMNSSDNSSMDPKRRNETPEIGNQDSRPSKRPNVSFTDGGSKTKKSLPDNIVDNVPQRELSLNKQSDVGLSSCSNIVKTGSSISLPSVSIPNILDPNYVDSITNSNVFCHKYVKHIKDHPKYVAWPSKDNEITESHSKFGKIFKSRRKKSIQVMKKATVLVQDVLLPYNEKLEKLSQKNSSKIKRPYHRNNYRKKFTGRTILSDSEHSSDEQKSHRKKIIRRANICDTDSESDKESFKPNQNSFKEKKTSEKFINTCKNLSGEKERKRAGPLSSKTKCQSTSDSTIKCITVNDDVDKIIDTFFDEIDDQNDSFPSVKISDSIPNLFIESRVDQQIIKSSDNSKTSNKDIHATYQDAHPNRTTNDTLDNSLQRNSAVPTMSADTSRTSSTGTMHYDTQNIKKISNSLIDETPTDILITPEASLRKSTVLPKCYRSPIQKFCSVWNHGNSPEQNDEDSSGLKHLFNNPTKIIPLGKKMSSINMNLSIPSDVNHRLSYKCTHCNESFDKRRVLENHEKQRHTNSNNPVTSFLSKNSQMRRSHVFSNKSKKNILNKNILSAKEQLQRRGGTRTVSVSIKKQRTKGDNRKDNNNDDWYDSISSDEDFKESPDSGSNDTSERGHKSGDSTDISADKQSDDDGLSKRTPSNISVIQTLDPDKQFVLEKLPKDTPWKPDQKSEASKKKHGDNSVKEDKILENSCSEPIKTKNICGDIHLAKETTVNLRNIRIEKSVLPTTVKHNMFDASNQKSSSKIPLRELRIGKLSNCSNSSKKADNLDIIDLIDEDVSEPVSKINEPDEIQTLPLATSEECSIGNHENKTSPSNDMSETNESTLDENSNTNETTVLEDENTDKENEVRSVKDVVERGHFGDNICSDRNDILAASATTERNEDKDNLNSSNVSDSRGDKNLDCHKDDNIALMKKSKEKRKKSRVNNSKTIKKKQSKKEETIKSQSSINWNRQKGLMVDFSKSIFIPKKKKNKDPISQTVGTDAVTESVHSILKDKMAFLKADYEANLNTNEPCRVPGLENKDYQECFEGKTNEPMNHNTNANEANSCSSSALKKTTMDEILNSNIKSSIDDNMCMDREILENNTIFMIVDDDENHGEPEIITAIEKIVSNDMIQSENDFAPGISTLGYDKNGDDIVVIENRTANIDTSIEKKKTLFPLTPEEINARLVSNKFSVPAIKNNRIDRSNEEPTNDDLLNEIIGNTDTRNLEPDATVTIYVGDQLGSSQNIQGNSCQSYQNDSTIPPSLQTGQLLNKKDIFQSFTLPSTYNYSTISSNSQSIQSSTYQTMPQAATSSFLSGPPPSSHERSLPETNHVSTHPYSLLRNNPLSQSASTFQRRLQSPNEPTPVAHYHTVPQPSPPGVSQPIPEVMPSATLHYPSNFPRTSEYYVEKPPVVSPHSVPNSLNPSTQLNPPISIYQGSSHQISAPTQSQPYSQAQQFPIPHANLTQSDSSDIHHSRPSNINLEIVKLREKMLDYVLKLEVAEKDLKKAKSLKYMKNVPSELKLKRMHERHHLEENVFKLKEAYEKCSRMLFERCKKGMRELPPQQQRHTSQHMMSDAQNPPCLNNGHFL